MIGIVILHLFRLKQLKIGINKYFISIGINKMEKNILSHPVYCKINSNVFGFYWSVIVHILLDKESSSYKYCR